MSEAVDLTHHRDRRQMTEEKTVALARRDEHTPVAPPMRPAGHLFPSVPLLELCDRIAQYVVESGEFDTRFKKGKGDPKAKVVMTLLKADTLGISFTDALEHVYVIDGKTGLSAQMMLRLINERAPGRTFEILQSDDKICRIRMGRLREPPKEFEFTIQRAERAGLLHYWKDGEKKEQFVWKAYREEMLQWRAVAKAARAVFPEILQGCYLLEELTSGPPLDNPDVAVEQQHYGQQRSRSQPRNGKGERKSKARVTQQPQQQSQQSQQSQSDPAREEIKKLLNSSVGFALQASGHSDTDQKWEQLFKDARHRLWDAMCQAVLGYVPDGEPDVTDEQISEMRVYLKGQKRDSLLNLVCRLGLLAEGANPKDGSWAQNLEATRQHTWSHMCKDVVGQELSPDAPLTEDLLDRMLKALSDLRRDLLAKLEAPSSS